MITAFVPVSGQLAVTLQDITQRVQMQTAMLRSDRLATIGMLAAAVAHEVNNPLTYVLGNLERMHEAMLAQPESRCGDLVAQAADSLEGSERIRRIVKDLRTFSRDEPGIRRDVLELTPIIKRAASLAAPRTRGSATVRMELDTVGPTLGDEGRLVQVLVNLLVNAAQAFEEVARTDVKILVRLRQEGRTLLLEVVDDGPGVPSAIADRIFDPFFTTKERGEGTGLGLSICRNIIQASGGEISLCDAPSGGTCVQVRLPVCARLTNVASAPASTPAKARADQPKRRILLVDDEPAVADIMVQQLHPHDVETARSGLDAQRLLGEDAQFDVILCDMVMTEGSGPELFEWLGEHYPALADRVVFMTGGAFTSSARAFIESATCPVLHKPVGREKLHDAVLGVMNGHGEGA